MGLWKNVPAVIGVLLLVACGSAEPSSTRLRAGPSPAPAPHAPASLRIDLAPLVKGPVSPSGNQAILGTGDLAVGANRVGFVLVSPKKLIDVPQVRVSSVYYPREGTPGEPGESVEARFRLWPYGTRGLYATHLTFPKAGWWGLDISIGREDGSQERVQLFFQVKEKPATPAVGAPAPRSASKTLADVARLEELSTGSSQDPDLYRVRIREAAASGRPSVIVFTSPAFCVNEVCGPQVEVLQELKGLYRGRAHFIHVDLYDNPHEIQGDLSQARLSPTVVEWSLPSIEWSFVLDREGRVAARFEAFATLEELREALERVL